MLNLDEGGTLRPRRVRWTDTAAVPVLVGAGAGFIEFDEFHGEGLRVLAFQHLCACYFEDGVGFLRRTGLTNNPYSREYVSKERGLLGKFAVCRVSGDQHFGIFTDGFFFFSSSGVWTEAGTLNIKVGVAESWTRTFFRLLNAEEKNRIQVSFNKAVSRIRISFPLGTEEDTNATWNYDMATDTMWPDEKYTPTCWGEAAQLVAAGVPWGGMVGNWANVLGTWGSYAPIYGDRAVIHGTWDGLVFLHSPSLYTRDENSITWYFTTHLFSATDVYSIKSTERITVEHANFETDTLAAFGFRNEKGDGLVAGVNMNANLTGPVAATSIHPSVNGYKIQIVGYGSDPVILYSFQTSFLPSVVPNKDTS